MNSVIAIIILRLIVALVANTSRRTRKIDGNEMTINVTTGKIYHPAEYELR